MTQLHEIRRQLTGAMVYTRRPLAASRAGQFRVRVRGAGTDLDQLRDYQPGDDVRFIDWKSSARVQRVVMRDYRDERSRLVQLVCDRSRSMNFGNFGQGARRMSECATEIATALAVLCENAGDACGLFLAHDRLCQRLNPACGKQQTGAIAAVLSVDSAKIDQQTTGSENLGQWCVDLGAHNLSASVIFIISDFIDDFDATLKKYAISLARRHVLVAIRVCDESERNPYAVGRQWLLRDSELAAQKSSDLRLEASADCRAAAQALADWRRAQKQEFLRAGFLVCDCFTSGSVVPQLCAGLRQNGLFAGRRR